MARRRDPPAERAARPHLPPLLGKAMLLYQLVYASLFTLAVVLSLLTLARTQWDGPERLPLLRVGVNYTRDASPHLLVFEVPGAQAQRAGIRPGDHILELSHRRTLDAGLNAVVDAPDGAVLGLTVRHSDGSVQRAALRVSSREVAHALRSVGLSTPFMSAWTRIVLGVAALIALTASVLLFRQRRNPVAALLALAALVPILTPTGIVGYEAALVGAAFAVALTNIGILAFPNGRFETRAASLLALANVAWFGVFFLSPTTHGAGIYPSIALSEITAVLGYRYVTGLADRQQIRWAAVGFVGASIFSVAAALVSATAYWFNGLFATIVHDMTTDALDLGNTLCLWGGLSIALLRFRLYDADVVITRSAMWVIAAPLLAIVFGVVLEIAKGLLSPIFPGGGLALATAGLVTATCVQPLSERIKKSVERWSRGPLITLADELPHALRDMEQATSVANMLQHACQACAAAVRVDTLIIAMSRNGEAWSLGAAAGLNPPAAASWLADHAPPAGLERTLERGDPLLPLRLPLIARPEGTPQAIGWMLVGRRPDGSLPDKGAVAALEQVAPAVGHSLLAVTARDARVESLRASLAGRSAPA